jgi:hypothetical protein
MWVDTGQAVLHCRVVGLLSLGAEKLQLLHLVVAVGSPAEGDAQIQVVGRELHHQVAGDVGLLPVQLPSSWTRRNCTGASA